MMRSFLFSCNAFAAAIISGFLLVVDASAQTIDLDNYQALTSDFKSYRVGEPITVMVLESTSAESTAGTGVNKDVSVFGEAVDNENSVGVSLDVGANSNGAGKTARSGRVKGQLSALITEVLPNQMYRIEGRQDLVINSEHQSIKVTGLIKGKDIRKDNSIWSYKIAEAKIEIVGDGDVTKAQRQNIFYKVMSWMGLL